MQMICCVGQSKPDGVRYVNVFRGPQYGMMTAAPHKSKGPKPIYRIKVTFK